MKYVYLVFYTSILNMCYEIEVFDSVFQNQSDAMDRVKQLKNGYITIEELK